jgi:hypothetical protein
MPQSGSNAMQRWLQILAVFCAIVIWAMILHKGSADVSALAQKHSGEEFWIALAKYFLRNLGGG